MYNYHNKDANNIGDDGMLHLFKGVWRVLERLQVSNKYDEEDRMRAGGPFYFTRGNWKFLTQL